MFVFTIYLEMARRNDIIIEYVNSDEIGCVQGGMAVDEYVNSTAC